MPLSGSLRRTIARSLACTPRPPPSRAEDATLGKTLKPLTGISIGLGSKRIVGYFVGDAQVCNLTLTIGDSIEGDEVPTSTPTRIVHAIAPNNTARVDTTELFPFLVSKLGPYTER